MSGLPVVPSPFSVPDRVRAAPPANPLPTLLVSMLVRRYLSAFRPDGWTLRPSENDAVSPVVCEVEALGQFPDADAMAHVLTACHEPGHAVVLVMHGGEAAGAGHRHRLYLGTRRLPGGRSTEDYLSGQAGALRGHFPGLKLGSAHPLGGLGEAIAFLRAAPALAALTGIPSGRGGRSPSRRRDSTVWRGPWVCSAISSWSWPSRSRPTSSIRPSMSAADCKGRSIRWPSGP